MTDEAHPTGNGAGIQTTAGGRGTSVAADRDVIVHSGVWAAAAWVGVTIAQTLISTLSTDALKAGLRKLGRREVSADPGAPDPDIVYLARTVANARCAALGRDGLPDDVEPLSWRTSDAVEVLFRARPRGIVASVKLLFDEQRADVKAEVRLADEFVSQRRKVTDSGEPFGVLGTADGWEELPA